MYWGVGGVGGVGNQPLSIIILKTVTSPIMCTSHPLDFNWLVNWSFIVSYMKTLDYEKHPFYLIKYGSPFEIVPTFENPVYQEECIHK